MKLQSKFMGFVVAVCVAIGIVGCGSSSGAPKCESSEVKKALENHHSVKGMKEIMGEIKFSDFKTLSEDKEYPNTMNCKCVVTMGGERQTLAFSAERLEDGRIAISIDDFIN